jgi:dynein heavy chain
MPRYVYTSVGAAAVAAKCFASEESFASACKQDVQKKLAAKHHLIAQRQIEAIALRTRTMCTTLGNTFRDLERELRKEPKTVDELTQMREQVKVIMATVAAQQPYLKDVADSFDLLDAFHYRLNKDMFRLRWTTLGWPRTIHDAQQSQNRVLQSEKETLSAQLRMKQHDLRSEISDVEKRVAMFGQHTISARDRDPASTRAIFDRVVALESKLKDMSDRAVNLRAAEGALELAGSEADQENLKQLTKSFEPYLQLWTSVHQWRENMQQWRTQPFHTLNSQAVEDLVNNVHRTLIKALKARVIRENADLSALAEETKKAVEHFRPFVPLIQALRSPGMRPRHWAMLTSQLHIPLSPDDTKMTLTTVRDAQ